MRARIDEADPFDLPDWVGELDVVWHTDTGALARHHISGRITASGRPDLACDALAIDQAYPEQVADSGWRRRAHQAWRHGEVLLVTCDGRLTLAVPGHEFSADLLLEALRRFTRAVGGRPERFVAALRLGDPGPRGR